MKKKKHDDSVASRSHSPKLDRVYIHRTKSIVIETIPKMPTIDETMINSHAGIFFQVKIRTILSADAYHGLQSETTLK